MTPVQSYNSITAKKLIESLGKRNMTGYYCESKEDALKQALEIIKSGSSVSWGGSKSLNDIGLIDALRSGGYKLIDRDNAKGEEEKRKAQLESFDSDYYLMSTNAITVDGRMVNIDGTGNRLAAFIYGPKHVVIVAGINKVVQTEEVAIARAKNCAAPKNAMRLSRKTPCVETAICHNCLNDDCICSNIVITRRSNVKDRVHVILVGEEVGF